MKVLLDTCTFLWIVADAPALSRRARELFQSADNEVYLSAASAWEIAVKHGLGRLPLPVQPERFVPDVRERHGIA
ncbi:MAG TPA: type II toxin-antitoxin system VapC family toxin, partial [Vicinamibacterales bacterium]